MKILKRKFLENNAAITIEASLISMIFISGYLIINSIALSLFTESMMRKALFELGMDMSAYIQIVDRMGKSNILDNKTNDIERYQDKVIEKIGGNSGIEDMVNSIRDLLKKDISGNSKTFIYNNLLKLAYINKIKSMNLYNSLKEIGLKESYNLNFEETKIFQNGNMLELNLKYTFKIENFGLLSIVNNVNQKLVIDNWVNRNSFDNKFNSIWDESNFDRGRYFANLIRGEKNIVLKSGTGFDYYDENKNELTQVVSLNIFSQSYSEKVNDKYFVTENFLKQVKEYTSKVESDYEKYSNKIQKKSGEFLKIDNPNLKLLIILPKEAEYMSNSKDVLKSISGNVEVEFIYLEKVFNDL